MKITVEDVKTFVKNGGRCFHIRREVDSTDNYVRNITVAYKTLGLRSVSGSPSQLPSAIEYGACIHREEPGDHWRRKNTLFTAIARFYKAPVRLDIPYSVQSVEEFHTFVRNSLRQYGCRA